MKYELKKDYLTREESNAIIINSMKKFFNSETNVIEGLNFEYLSLEERFFDSLGLLCIKDYNDKLKEYIYNEGKEEELLCSIKNAEDTYEMLYLIADKASSLENLLSDFLKKLPNMDDLKNIDDLIPQIKDAFDKYDKITKGEATEK